MLIFSQVPRQRPEGASMPQQFANIRWSHAHFVHPGRGGGACSMGSNASYYVRLADSGQLAQEGDHTLIEEVSSHEFVAILEEIVGGLAGLAINQRLLIWGAHTFPHFNGVCHIRKALG